MYFNTFPKIYYDFDFNGEDQSLRILTDITKNIRVRKAILENITLYDEYDVQEGDTFEIISERIYGNPEYHWILMILNQRYDYINDLPIHQYEFDEYVDSIYGEGNANVVHHYEKSGLVVEAKATLKVPTNTIDPDNKFKINDYILNSTTYARVDAIDVAERRLSISLQRGSFKFGDMVEVYGFRDNEEKQTTEYTRALVFQIPQNALNIPDVYSPVTNYDHEIKLNEKKRRIKILSPELLPQVLREFSELIRQNG